MNWFWLFIPVFILGFLLGFAVAGIRISMRMGIGLKMLIEEVRERVDAGIEKAAKAGKKE